MRLLLTRPHNDGDPLEAMLRAAGHQVWSEPLLAIHHLPVGNIDPLRLRAVVVTSSNALRALDPSAGLESIPLFAVGSATARLAAEKGFASIVEGAAGAAELAAVLVETLAPARGRILYLRGEETAFEMEPALAQAGLEVESRVVYRAEPVNSLGNDTTTRLKGGQLDGVVLLSPRTAATYVRLVQQAGLADSIGNLIHFGLSDRVVIPLKNLGIGSIRVPAQPKLQELVALVDASATHCPLSA